MLVELTEQSRARDLWQRSVAVQAEKETTVAAALSDTEKRELNDLLRRLLHAVREVHRPLSRKRS